MLDFTSYTSWTVFLDRAVGYGTKFECTEFDVRLTFTFASGAIMMCQIILATNNVALHHNGDDSVYGAGIKF